MSTPTLRATPNPLVSAIIIFLNEERFLPDAIESVLAQTYENWELLLVDDGSSDASPRIARAYAERDPTKIRYLTHPGGKNQGMSASRALGLREARGEYVASLDGDDVWLPHKLEIQLAAFAAYPEAAMVCGPLLLWHSWTGSRDDARQDGFHGGGGRKPHPFADTLVRPPRLLSLFLRDREFIPAAALVKREAVLAVGGPEERFRGSYEDAVVAVKLCLSHSVFVSGACLYKYRIHPDSWERRTIKAGQSDAAFLTYMLWVQQYIGRQPLPDIELQRALKRGVWHARHPVLHRLLDYRYQARRIIQATKAVARRAMPAAMYDWLSFRWKAASSWLPSTE